MSHENWTVKALAWMYCISFGNSCYIYMYIHVLDDAALYYAYTVHVHMYRCAVKIACPNSGVLLFCTV